MHKSILVTAQLLHFLFFIFLHYEYDNQNLVVSYLQNHSLLFLNNSITVVSVYTKMH